MSENQPNNRSNAVLSVGNFADRKVCDYNYEFSQAFNTDNQPTTAPRGGTLYVKVDAFSHEGNLDLLNWMLREDLKLNGKLTVYKPSDPNIVLKTIEFEDAYCVWYKETWKDVKSNQVDSTNQEEIKIVWQTFKVGTLEYKY